MLATGLVTAFPALVVTQMLWGLGWTFSSGADVAWLSDELDQPDRVAGVLTAGARWEQLGAAGGLVGFGTLAWATDLGTSIVISGAAMVALGLFVMARFTENHFTPTREHRHGDTGDHDRSAEVGSPGQRAETHQTAGGSKLFPASASRQ